MAIKTSAAVPQSAEYCGCGWLAERGPGVIPFTRLSRVFLWWKPGAPPEQAPDVAAAVRAEGDNIIRVL